MPNYFKSPGPPTGGKAARRASDAADNVLTRTLASRPGLWHRVKLGARQSQAITDVRSAELEAVKSEVKALVVQAAKMHGAEIRAENSREHAIVLAATVNEATRDHAAIALEQQAVRMAGSFVNLKALAEARQDIERLAQELPISPEEREALLATAKGLHAELEGRIDRAYELGRDLTDQNFELGVAPAKSILSKL